MFFRETHSKNSKKPTLQLVQNRRTKKGSRQRIVASLGTKMHIPKNLRAAVARLVEERLKGQLSLFDNDSPALKYADRIVKKIQTDGKWRSERIQVKNFKEDKDTVEVFIDDVEHGQDRILGPLLVGHHFWNRLDFPNILANCNFTESQIATAELSVLNRLIEQGSELSIPQWIKTIAAEEIIINNAEDFAKERFYKISDKLLKNKEQLEKDLYKREKYLFNLEDCIFLYDLTNTYFEGLCAQNPKAQFNKNQKEKRTDCRQIVVALSIDSEGFIRKHQVFEGKMSDSKSLIKILDLLRTHFKGKHMPTIIFDRGMVSKDNINLIESEPYCLKYIVASRSGEEKEFISEFQKSTFKTITEESEKNKVEIFLKKKDSITYLLCKSQGRYEKESAMRNNKEKKLEDELNSLKSLIEKGKRKDPKDIERMIGRKKEKYSTVAKYYKITFDAQYFDFVIPEGVVIPKRLVNSLNSLKTKINTYKINYLKAKVNLEKLGKKYNNFSKIQIQIKEPNLSWNVVDELEAKARVLDGNYLLKTNRDDLSDTTIWNMYMMLTRVENAFRNLKSHLGLRPNRHHKEGRVDGHVNISILAYHLLHAIEFTICKKGENCTWPTIKRIINNHTYSTIILPTSKGSVINLRKAGIPENIHQEIYKKLGVNYTNLPVTKILA